MLCIKSTIYLTGRANHNNRNSKFQTCSEYQKRNLSKLFWSLDIEFCDLFVIWCLLFEILTSGASVLFSASRYIYSSRLRYRVTVL